MALPAGRDPIEGRAAICEFFDELSRNAGLRFDLGVIQAVAGDEMGYWLAPTSRTWAIRVFRG